MSGLPSVLPSHEFLLITVLFPENTLTNTYDNFKQSWLSLWYFLLHKYEIQIRNTLRRILRNLIYRPQRQFLSVHCCFFPPPWLENTKFLVFCFRIFPSSTVRQPWLLSFPIICLRTFPKRKLLFPVRKKTALLRVHLANPGACNAQLKVISTIFFFVRRCLWHCNGARCVWVWDCTCVCVCGACGVCSMYE